MFMLTGAGLGEMRQARFEQFNLEHMSWSKPPTMTKQRRAHRVPISDETAAIVRQRQLLAPKGSPWLFPVDTPGQPVQEVRRFWAQVQKQCGLQDVRIHDLRHLRIAAGQRRGLAGNDRKTSGAQPDADDAALCPPDGFAPTRWG